MKLLTKGWRWTPEDVAPTTKEHIGVIERQKHNLVVTARETKPIEERNQYIYFSDKGARPVSFKLADQVGFSGVRAHWIPWGPYGSDPLCIQPEDYLLTGSTMYFITGLDQSKLDKLEGCENLVLANEQQRNSINAAPVPTGVASGTPIFDKNIFAVQTMWCGMKTTGHG